MTDLKPTSMPTYMDVAPGAHRRRIATLSSPPAEARWPSLMWFPGLKSDMVSTKAVALADWASARGIGMTRFDYSGHGRSSGRFEDAVVGDWVDEAEAVFVDATSGSQFFVGSSTGAHIALVLLRRMMRKSPAEAARIKGLVLIAPAWDLTEALMWDVFDARQRSELMEVGRTVLPSDYDPAGFVITRAFIEEGRNHLFGDRPFDPGRPVHILQGLQDTSVPPAHARKLAAMLTGGWAELTEIADGDHRLSRPQDLELLFTTVATMIERATSAAE